MHVKTHLRAGNLTVYGTERCGWTQKQLTYLDERKIPYTFVNCDQGKCPSFVSALPTLVQNGQVLVGYTEL